MKTFLIILVLGTLTAALPAQAKIQENAFWAAVGRLAQGIMGEGEGEGFEQPPVEEEMVDEDFVDPRELQQVQRELKDQKRELNRLIKSAKRLAGGDSIVAEISALLEQVNNFEAQVNAGIGLRDIIQEFRDAQLWEELNKVRAKVEIPKELSQWQRDIKRVGKMLSQKKNQNLGLDVAGTSAKLEEVRSVLARVQELYNSGDFESAMGEFDDLRQDFHPGEIMSVVQRMGDLMNRLRTVKSVEVKSQIQEALAEVIDNFNQGEYRIARELMDESWNDLMKLVNQALMVGKKKGVSRDNFIKMTDRLEEQMRNKAGEKKIKMEEMREQREEAGQIQPQAPQEKQPQQQPIQTKEEGRVQPPPSGAEQPA